MHSKFQLRNVTKLSEFIERTNNYFKKKKKNERKKREQTKPVK